jgi:hypothetical protein
MSKTGSWLRTSLTSADLFKNFDNLRDEFISTEKRPNVDPSSTSLPKNENQTETELNIIPTVENPSPKSEETKKVKSLWTRVIQSKQLQLTSYLLLLGSITALVGQFMDFLITLLHEGSFFLNCELKHVPLNSLLL